MMLEQHILDILLFICLVLVAVCYDRSEVLSVAVGRLTLSLTRLLWRVTRSLTYAYHLSSCIYDDALGASSSI